MPANFDLFSTAVMLKAIEQTPRVYTFLSDTFAADGGLCEDERAMYDYRKGAESGLAPFVVPNAGGVTINRDPYEMRQIQFSVAPFTIWIQLTHILHRSADKFALHIRCISRRKISANNRPLHKHGGRSRRDRSTIGSARVFLLACTHDIHGRCHKIRLDRPCDRVATPGLQKQSTTQVIVATHCDGHPGGTGHCKCRVRIR